MLSKRIKLKTVSTLLVLIFILLLWFLIRRARAKHNTKIEKAGTDNFKKRKILILVAVIVGLILGDLLLYFNQGRTLEFIIGIDAIVITVFSLVCFFVINKIKPVGSQN